MLASQVGGNSAPSGSTYSPVNVGQPLAAGISEAVSSSFTAKRQEMDKEKMAVEIQKLAADARLAQEKKRTEQSTQVLQATTAAQGAAGIKKTMEDTQNVMEQNRILRENYWSARRAATESKKQQQILDTPYIGQGLRWLNEVSKALQGALNNAGAIKSLAPPSRNPRAR